MSDNREIPNRRGTPAERDRIARGSQAAIDETITTFKGDLSMKQLKTRLAAFGFALILVGIPVLGQANEGTTDGMFIDIEDQKLVAEKLHYLWNPEAVYALTRTPPEDNFENVIALQPETQVADVETVAFLEKNVVNLWAHPDLLAEYGIKGEPVADFAEVEMTGLDWHRIRFLEENIWDYDVQDEPGVEIEKTGVGAPALDLDLFSDEIPWQDDLQEENARFAQTEPDNFYPEADDVPQLRAGQVDY